MIHKPKKRRVLLIRTLLLSSAKIDLYNGVGGYYALCTFGARWKTGFVHAGSEVRNDQDTGLAAVLPLLVSPVQQIDWRNEHSVATQDERPTVRWIEHPNSAPLRCEIEDERLIADR